MILVEATWLTKLNITKVYLYFLVYTVIIKQHNLDI